MATSADDLLKKALELDELERARLVAELLETLPPDTLSSLSDSEWILEIERRAREALSERPAVPWNEARRRIEDSFQRKFLRVPGGAQVIAGAHTKRRPGYWLNRVR